MIAKIQSLHVQGVECTPVDIEVDVSSGLPQFVIVGLPDAAVSEARDRVRTAIQNSGFSFPRTRVTVNLAPAHAKKGGSLFDLPIALGILFASGVIHKAPDALVIGELALDGSIRPVRGALPLVYTAVNTYKRHIIMPQANSEEASLVPQHDFIFPASTLTEVVVHCRGETLLQPMESSSKQSNQPIYPIDMSDIVGQQFAKRALEVAASGAHNIVLLGSPGAGKTLLAQSLLSILPPMTEKETLEATMVHSVSEDRPTTIVRKRPFRAPHHTATAVAIIGGGPHVKPGEISLAHHGILFFDELPEFQRQVLEALRQPLEAGQITISRAHGTVTYPAQFQFVAALNPCPCGFAGSAQAINQDTQQCTCSQASIDRYQKKLSGPLLDRIDLKIHITPVAKKDLTQRDSVQTETSAQIRDRVIAAREKQLERQGKPNAHLTRKEIQKKIVLDTHCEQLLHTAMDKHSLSMRGYMKTVKVARSIADLAGQKDISPQHIAEALSYTKQLNFL